MKKLYYALVLIGIGILTINFSEQQSIRKERPDVNVAGMITTQAGESITAQNITISGKWERITVYSQPETGMDPKKYAVSFDLDELREIHIANIEQALFSYQPPDITERRDDGSIEKKHPKPVEYIQFETIYKGKEQDPSRIYLIERDKKIWFDEMIGNNRVEHRPHFEAIKKIVITSITSNKDDEKEECVYTPQAVRVQNLSHQEKVYNELDKLAATTEKLPIQTTTADLSTWKEKFAEILKELRDSIAKVFKQ